ncbi:MAG: TonB-dependent SusC/RagA subfamily outer membrane receptor [Arenicella sp.]|jgi:TonB-dependent SusC/RagA subfamily outer membrane receptor
MFNQNFNLMRTLKITFVFLLLSTIAFSQSKEKIMLSDKVREVMIEELNFDYDSISFILSEKDTGQYQYVGRLPKDYIKYACYLPANRKPTLPLLVLEGKVTKIGDLGEMQFEPNNHKIQILTGAYASAIYGSRAVHGVVVISTEKSRKLHEKRVRKLKRKKDGK